MHVKKLFKSRLQKTNLSEFESKFNDLVAELYNSTEDQYSKCRCVFETKIVEYCHEVNEHITTIIENVSEDIMFHRKDIGFLELPPSIFKLRKLFLKEQGICMKVIDKWLWMLKKITNRQAVKIFENIKLLSNNGEQLTASIGENESINADALLRKIRWIWETIAKKSGKYKTDFEHQNFDIAANISKTVYSFQQ